MLMSVGRVHQLFGLEMLRPAVLTGALALVLYVFDRREVRRARYLWVPTTKWLLALFVWMVLSVPGSLAEGISFTLVFENFLKTVLMYGVTISAVRGVRDVERLVMVYLLAAATYAAVVLARFDPSSGGEWRLGHLYYYDANDFATFAVTALPFGLYFFHAARRPLLRVVACGSIAVLTLAFVWSGSRGGFLALGAVGTFVLLRYREIPVRWRVSAAALVAVVILAAASDHYWERMGTILSDADYNRTSETGRLQIWQRGFGYMLEYPVFGVGPNNFPAAEGTLSPFADRQQFGVGVRWSAAHNSYVQIGAELGFPGLLLFVAVIASGFMALRTAHRTGLVASGGPVAPPELIRALTASLIAFVIGAAFLSLAYSEMLYTLLALAVALDKAGALPHERPGRSAYVEGDTVT